MTYPLHIKRILDLSFALLLLAVLWPLLLMTVIILFINQQRTIVFKQQRIGYRNTYFTIYKFCTMTDRVDHLGNLLPDTDRLTTIGKWLRKTSLDELPQLWNIVKGDMSFVGPRPLLVEYLPLYTPEQATRHLVRPGVSGWAQINGRNAITWTQKFKLDSWYVANCSWKLDMYILFRTIGKVFLMSNVQQPGHATTQKFNGLN